MAGNTGWQISNRNTIGGFSAVCNFFGRRMYERLNIPIGLIGSSVGGSPIEAWLTPEGMATCKNYQNKTINNIKFGTLEKKNETNVKFGPTEFYNGMIHPLLGSKIKGALWYQGESNAGAWDKYLCQKKALVEYWRQRFNTKFFFLFVQLAGFQNLDFRLIRLVQSMVPGNVELTQMATAIDLGHPTDVNFIFLF